LQCKTCKETGTEGITERRRAERKREKESWRSGPVESDREGGEERCRDVEKWRSWSESFDGSLRLQNFARWTI